MRWALTLGALAHLILAMGVGLSVDEAHYALYAYHLDWSYFDHPPLVGWLQWPAVALGGGRLGLAHCSFGLRWCHRLVAVAHHHSVGPAPRHAGRRANCCSGRFMAVVVCAHGPFIGLGFGA